jgi:intracellular multiplication protein IcmJ
MKNIILSVKRKDFRGDSLFPVDNKDVFESMRPTVLSRDKFTCQYCEFYSKKYQEIHHLDDDHNNNDIDNLVTTCSICHMCHHIGFAGVKSKGVLIYINPDNELNITQAKINNIVRALWVYQSSTENKIAAMQALDYLKRFEKLRISADKHLGSCDPIVLGNFLKDLNEEKYNKRDEILKGVFFLPFKEGFQEQYTYWRGNVFKTSLQTPWPDLSKSRAMEWADIGGFSKNLEGLKSYLSKNKLY